MKRNPNSGRSKKWLKYNDINNINCYEFIKKIIFALCPGFYFEIQEHRKHGNELCLYKNNDKRNCFTIFVDKQFIELKVTKFTEGKIIKLGKFSGDACWLNALKAIAVDII